MAGVFVSTPAFAEIETAISYNVGEITLFSISNTSVRVTVTPYVDHKEGVTYTSSREGIATVRKQSGSQG